MRRRGKILIIDFIGGSSLVFHLKMTGQLIFNGKPSRYTRKVFNFDNGSRLIFNDARKFGWYKTVKNTDSINKELGPEALEIGSAAFKQALAKRPNSKIKPLLMDQKFIAGIGNIYSDEILFASRVHPLRFVKTLNEQEVKIIFKNIKKILKKAIEMRGSSIRHYIDACGREGEYANRHRVYQREKCSFCSSRIKRIKIGGRSAYFCPKCQLFA